MKFYKDEVYIKMCKTAKEIQDIWQSMCRKSEGDNYFWNYHFEEGYKGSFYINNDNASLNLINGFSQCVDYEYCSESLNGNTDIWLPRQDQLQERILIHHKDYEPSPFGLLLNFNQWMVDSLQNEMHPYYNFYDGKEQRGLTTFKSIESIWMVYLMKTLYNKTWNGEEWN